MASRERASVKARGRFLLRVLLPLALMGLIFVASSRQLPAAGTGQLDKVLHAVVFGALAGAWVYALAPTAMGRGRGIALATLVSILWGVIDELHQSFVPGRVASVADAVADLVGASALGVVVFWLGGASTRDEAAARPAAASTPEGDRGGERCAPQ